MTFDYSLWKVADVNPCLYLSLCVFKKHGPRDNVANLTLRKMLGSMRLFLLNLIVQLCFTIWNMFWMGGGIVLYYLYCIFTAASSIFILQITRKQKKVLLFCRFEYSDSNEFHNHYFPRLTVESFRIVYLSNESTA